MCVCGLGDPPSGWGVCGDAIGGVDSRRGGGGNIVRYWNNVRRNRWFHCFGVEPSKPRHESKIGFFL